MNQRKTEWIRGWKRKGSFFLAVLLLFAAILTGCGTASGSKNAASSAPEKTTESVQPSSEEQTSLPEETEEVKELLS